MNRGMIRSVFFFTLRDGRPGERVTVSDKDATTIDLKGRAHTDVLASFGKGPANPDESCPLQGLKSNTTGTLGIKTPESRWIF